MTETIWTRPGTNVALQRLSPAEANRAAKGDLAATNPTPIAGIAIDELYFDSSAMEAYPEVDGIPILMEPELLKVHSDSTNSGLLDDPLYAGVYEEMKFYDQWAATDVDDNVFQADLAFLQELIGLASELTFPNPGYRWLRPSPALGGETQMFRSVAPVNGRSCLQIGGRGVEGVTLAIAGADSVLVVSPMIEELRYGRALAKATGVDDRVEFCCAIAEALPIPTASIDCVVSRHSLHHTKLDLALAEVERVLAPAGKFASVDVWRAPLYDLGIRYFGKMTPGVNCRPLSKERLDEVTLSRLKLTESSHGALLRYPLVLLQRKGFLTRGPFCERAARLEDWITRRIRFVARQRSLVSLSGSFVSDDQQAPA